MRLSKNKTFWLATFCFFIFCESSKAQSPYVLNTKKDISTVSTGAILWGGGVYLRRHDDVLTLDEVEMLNKEDLHGFRQWVVDNNSLTAGRASDHLKNTSNFLPLLFLVDKQPRNDLKALSVMYLEATLLTRGLTSMTKYVQNRSRPFVYNEDISIEKKTAIRAKQSFFSGHTSKTATMCFFTAKVFADYYPESKWKPFVWTTAALIPAATGYFRVAAGQHFPSDVIVGYIVGGSIGYLVPHFHLKNRKKGKLGGLDLRGGINGFYAGYTF